MRYRTLFISASLVVGVCAYGVYRFGFSPSRPGASHDPARLAQEVAQLKSQVASLQTRGKSHRSRSASEPDTGKPRRPLDPVEQQKKWRAHMATVEKRFIEEPADPNWAATAAATVKEKVQAAEGMRGTMRALECRSQTCRLEMLVDDSGKFEEALPDSLMSLTETLPKMQGDTREEPNGQKLLVLFLSKRAPAA